MCILLELDLQLKVENLVGWGGELGAISSPFVVWVKCEIVNLWGEVGSCLEMYGS